MRQFGRDVISIPLSRSSLSEETIGNYLNHILMRHTQNVEDYLHLKDYYKGKQEILYKERPFSNRQNNIVVENHAFTMVEFKKGYNFGNDLKYSCADDTECTDDITLLSKYMRVQRKALKNVEIAEDVYICGSGLRMVVPNADMSSGSPFSLYNLDYTSSFIVYSSNYKHEKLFGGVITALDSLNDTTHADFEIMISDSRYTYKFECTIPHDSKYEPLSIYGIPKFVSKEEHYIGYVPFVEYYANSSRIGTIEVVEPILDNINTISSNAVDNVVDYVNAILVFYNTEITEEEIRSVKELGAVELNTKNPNIPVDLKYLINQLNQEDVMSKYESLVSTAYSIVGVPLATSSTTSGGDTGEARLLGGGWTRADIVATQESILLTECEREMVEICISICKRNLASGIETITIGDVNIDFQRTKTDNLLVKAQALKYFIDLDMPYETALSLSELPTNIHEVAHAWENNAKIKAQERLEQELYMYNAQADTHEDSDSQETSEDTKEKETSGSENDDAYRTTAKKKYYYTYKYNGK